MQECVYLFSLMALGHSAIVWDRGSRRKLFKLLFLWDSMLPQGEAAARQRRTQWKEVKKWPALAMRDYFYSWGKELWLLWSLYLSAFQDQPLSYMCLTHLWLSTGQIRVPDTTLRRELLRFYEKFSTSFLGHIPPKILLAASITPTERVALRDPAYHLLRQHLESQVAAGQAHRARRLRGGLDAPGLARLARFRRSSTRRYLRTILQSRAGARWPRPFSSLWSQGRESWLFDYEFPDNQVMRDFLQAP